MAYFLSAPLLAAGLCITTGPTSVAPPTTNLPDRTEASASEAVAALKWMTFEEAVAAQKQSPKRLLIDIYTDWCGWCKRMDAGAWKDPEVVAYIQENFYAVKFNAEQKEPITYDGHTFNFQKLESRGVHELAASLTDNRLTYPVIVYFNDKMERQMISAGFKDAPALLVELKKVVGGA